ncbi:MAG: hypothetical protein JWN03_559 [Nocardia sp.]|nr:hypothetical protein [Nocardia sp.]
MFTTLSSRRPPPWHASEPATNGNSNASASRSSPPTCFTAGLQPRRCYRSLCGLVLRVLGLVVLVFSGFVLENGTTASPAAGTAGSPGTAEGKSGTPPDVPSTAISGSARTREPNTPLSRKKPRCTDLSRHRIPSKRAPHNPSPGPQQVHPRHRPDNDCAAETPAVPSPASDGLDAETVSAPGFLASGTQPGSKGVSARPEMAVLSILESSRLTSGVGFPAIETHVGYGTRGSRTSSLFCMTPGEQHRTQLTPTAEVGCKQHSPHERGVINADRSSRWRYQRPGSGLPAP